MYYKRVLGFWASEIWRKPPDNCVVFVQQDTKCLFFKQNLDVALMQHTYLDVALMQHARIYLLNIMDFEDLHDLFDTGRDLGIPVNVMR